MVSFRRTHYRISLRRFFARGAYRQEGPTGQKGLLARRAYWPDGPTGQRGPTGLRGRFWPRWHPPGLRPCLGFQGLAAYHNFEVLDFQSPTTKRTCKVQDPSRSQTLDSANPGSRIFWGPWHKVRETSDQDSGLLRPKGTNRNNPPTAPPPRTPPGPAAAAIALRF